MPTLPAELLDTGGLRRACANEERPLGPLREACARAGQWLHQQFSDDRDIEELIRLRANQFRKRLHNAVADNSPGDRIEDRRLDVLIEELGIVLAEVALR